MTEIKKQGLTVTVDEAARMLGISRNSCYQACHTGELPVIRLGKRLVIPVRALEKMLEGNGSNKNQTLG